MPFECAIFPSNRYHAGETCEHCSGIIRPEYWCITRNTTVRYAYENSDRSKHAQLADRLILHALGVEELPQTNANGRAPDRTPH